MLQLLLLLGLRLLLLSCAVKLGCVDAWPVRLCLDLWEGAEAGTCLFSSTQSAASKPDSRHGHDTQPTSGSQCSINLALHLSGMTTLSPPALTRINVVPTPQPSESMLLSSTQQHRMCDTCNHWDPERFFASPSSLSVWYTLTPGYISSHKVYALFY